MIFPREALLLSELNLEALAQGQALLTVFDTLLLSLVQQDPWPRCLDFFQILFQLTAVWFIVVALLSSFLHLSIGFHHSWRVDWFASFRAMAYVLVPMLSLMLIAKMFLILDARVGFMSSDFLSSKIAEISLLILNILTVVWPYCLLMWALEEIHGLSRVKAQFVILTSVFMGLAFLMFLFGQGV
jgi:hypothetical protein